MPMYRSPTPTPPSSPTRSRSRTRTRSRSKSRADSRSRARSQSRSNSRTRARSRPPSPTPASESVVKTSLVFLGSIAAATLAAHKLWPKGITYGEKEEWEKIVLDDKAQRRAARRDEAARRDGSGRRGAEPGYPPREERRRQHREGAGWGPGDSSGAGSRSGSSRASAEDPRAGRVVYERIEDERRVRRPRETSRGRGYGDERAVEYRPGERSGGRPRQLSLDRGDHVTVGRRGDRQEARYYPPTTRRYVVEGSASGPHAREVSVERAGVTVEYLEPQVVYVPRQGPERRARHNSVDAGRRYEVNLQ